MSTNVWKEHILPFSWFSKERVTMLKMETASSSETLVAYTSLHYVIFQNTDIFFGICCWWYDDDNDDDDDNVKLHFFLQDPSAFSFSTLVTDALLHYVKVHNALTNRRTSPFNISVPISQKTHHISFEVCVYRPFFLWEPRTMNKYTVWVRRVIE